MGTTLQLILGIVGSIIILVIAYKLASGTTRNVDEEDED